MRDFPEGHTKTYSSANSAIASEPRLLARAAPKLQHKDGVTLRDVRVLFDKLLDEFESAGACSKHLAVASKVVAVPDFENAVVKVQEGRSRELSKVEEQAIQRLLGSPTVLEEDVRGSLGFADAALLERRVTVETQYPNLDWIPPTSDDVERLSAEASLVYSDRRMSMSPDTLKLILYLRFNRTLWNEVSVARALRRQEASRKRKRQLSLFEGAIETRIV
ncbi:unnamed protein product [Phytophthora fragariaefolia]|uniref:Unnamed protein product n=1 Tax=Phytophthora fragariaefolia TaxID=1490495 RepID=A0A9W6XMN1_9STRA|nr:unnamed protein product [Phytophthora fragariaefolia]